MRKDTQVHRSSNLLLAHATRQEEVLGTRRKIKTKKGTTAERRLRHTRLLNCRHLVDLQRIKAWKQYRGQRQEGKNRIYKTRVPVRKNNSLWFPLLLCLHHARCFDWGFHSLSRCHLTFRRSSKRLWAPKLTFADEVLLWLTVNSGWKFQENHRTIDFPWLRKSMKKNRNN